jgi:Tol biopolymer transport system component
MPESGLKKRPAIPCKTTFKRAPDGIVVWSPNSKQYLINKQDSAGIFQIYVGNAGSAPVCISCTQQAHGPAPSLHKLQPRWYPSGQWIVLAVEQANFQPPLLATPALILGWLQSGIWVNIFMARPDGSEWYQLSDFGADQAANGFTGVAFTPDGTKAVWAQILNGTIPPYLFGQWRLMLADYQESGGVPSFSNIRDITPAGAIWVEPGNFAPDGKSLLITSDIGMTNPVGMDQFIVNIDTGDVRNLTNSPNVWDEHGVFSPDGSKILFMSSYPFQNNPLADTVLFLETEFMLMDSDGSHLVQLSHFNSPGYPESNPPNQKTVAAVGAWNRDSRSISALNLIFPNYQTWSISFYGLCATVLRPEAQNFFPIRR